jgi:hypothetical protein
VRELFFAVVGLALGLIAGLFYLGG